MREFFLEIEKRITTKEDLIFYLQQIDLAAELVLKGIKKNTIQKLKGKINKELIDILAKSEKRKEEKLKISEQQVFFLELLKEHLLSLPQVKMEIAFSPDDKTILKISHWLEKELAKKIILDLKVNSRIVGGAIVEYKGKLVDFSLVKEIKKMKLETSQEK